MSITRKDQLFNLIKSLSKSEKRNFKLYVNRLKGNEHVKFIRLFDVIDKSKEFRKGQIKDKFDDISNTQFANLKRHLYAQILKSLRLIHNEKEVDLKVRELLDYAKILYTKSLYLQSLKILDKARVLCENANQDLLLLEILEFEKLIESRHITRSRRIKDKVEKLIEESSKIKKVIGNASDLVNLNLKIHGLYIKMGHAKTELDQFIVKDYFQSNLPSLNSAKLTFFEKVYLHQSYVWYYYTLTNFSYCYRHSLKWVTLFHDRPFMIQKDADLYMRGMHYLLTTLYVLEYHSKFIEHYHRFERFHKNHHGQFNPTSQLIYFIYGYNAKLNYYFLQGRYREAKQLIPAILSKMEHFEMTLDQHRKIIFYYKIAWLHFCIAEYEEALDYLHWINNHKKEHLRADILSYTKLMILLCHYQMGNHTLVSNLIASVRRYCNEMDEKNRVLEEVLSYLRAHPNINSASLDALRKLKDDFLIYRSNPFLKRTFIYFNFISWLDNMLQNQNIAELKRVQFQNAMRNSKR